MPTLLPPDFLLFRRYVSDKHTFSVRFSSIELLDPLWVEDGVAGDSRLQHLVAYLDLLDGIGLDPVRLVQLGDIARKADR